MPLSDGTNDEGEDLSVPLPTNEWKEPGFFRIVLYGTHASPATCKTRALLNLAGVPYERRFGKKSGAIYQKFPVAVISHCSEGGSSVNAKDDSNNNKFQLSDERQINDSHIIYKNLASILFPSLGSPSKEDIEVEKEATYGLMLACEVEAFRSSDCMARWAFTAGLGSGMSGFFIRTVAPLSLARGAADRISKRTPNLQTPGDYCNRLKRELDRRGTSYFNGDDAGPLDASIYGAIAVWAPAGDGPESHQTMPFMADALKASKLDEWYERMGRRIPNMWEKQGIWPFYT
jgi:hypothetical protein